MALPYLPKSTRVSGTKWRVRAKRTVKYPDGEPCDGICHYDHKLIEIAVESEDEFHILDSFYHEIGHAIIDEAGIELEENVEHAIIRQLAKWLATHVDYRKAARKPKSKKEDSKAPKAAKKRKR